MKNVDMDRFNRIAMIVVAAVAMFFMLILLLIMFVGLGAPSLEAAVTPGELFMASLANAAASVKLATLLLALLVFLLGGALLYYELQSELQIKSIPLTKDDKGSISVRGDGISNLVEYVALQVPDVLEVSSDPTMTRQGLNIHCRVLLSPTAQINQVRNMLTTNISEEVMRHFNINVADVGILTTTKVMPGETPSLEAS